MTVVAIPAYEPDHRLVDLASALRARDPGLDIVVADDGSGVASAPVFASLEAEGVTVLSHGSNRGKGAALHTLFRYARTAHPGTAVVTADADGQHAPDDIVRVARETERSGDVIVLGVRDFTGDDVPLRSRFGNAVSARLFALAIGERVVDTQTGLRGLPPQALPWATRLPGERFEYEAIMLLNARRAGFRLAQTPIETVYLDENRSSHFRPLRDSLRVMAPLAAFLGSSLIAATLDALLLWLFLATTGWLQGAIVAARLVSATVNFAVNRTWVFGRGRERAPLRVELVRYATLAGAVLTANVGLMTLLDALGVGLVTAKVVTEIALWFAGFAAQRAWVFAHGRVSRRPASKPYVLA
ncbi:bifunctional glycosyltransferase family 2/GtrA family protein [Microbacterium betulae]|uniref:Bifunctional glycosyltransferase family 2/GtrA family protein n=1 Tax=Microbacterium betulae TaxID=2981139 RepID=A0AA97FHJ0_9MICO|nr:bifunctional glycosyltransferase family 2/GtrA family protein [Microbacterium sp. AB]WOF22194.1 bifunctional glycosyltransferase family 2/GtrA family protein [Microbacterium sp. AB]